MRYLGFALFLYASTGLYELSALVLHMQGCGPGFTGLHMLAEPVDLSHHICVARGLGDRLDLVGTQRWDSKELHWEAIHARLCASMVVCRY